MFLTVRVKRMKNAEKCECGLAIHWIAEQFSELAAIFDPVVVHKKEADESSMQHLKQDLDLLITKWLPDVSKSCGIPLKPMASKLEDAKQFIDNKKWAKAYNAIIASESEMIDSMHKCIDPKWGLKQVQ